MSGADGILVDRVCLTPDHPHREGPDPARDLGAHRVGVRHRAGVRADPAGAAAVRPELRRRGHGERGRRQRVRVLPAAVRPGRRAAHRPARGAADLPRRPGHRRGLHRGHGVRADLLAAARLPRPRRHRLGDVHRLGGRPHRPARAADDPRPGLVGLRVGVPLRRHPRARSSVACSATSACGCRSSSTPWPSLIAAALVGVFISGAALRPAEGAPVLPVMTVRDGWRDSAYRASIGSAFANGWANFGVRNAILPLFAAVVIGKEPWVAGTALAVFAAGNAVGPHRRRAGCPTGSGGARSSSAGSSSAGWRRSSRASRPTCRRSSSSPSSRASARARSTRPSRPRSPTSSAGSATAGRRWRRSRCRPTAAPSSGRSSPGCSSTTAATRWRSASPGSSPCSPSIPWLLARETHDVRHGAPSPGLTGLGRGGFARTDERSPADAGGSTTWARRTRATRSPSGITSTGGAGTSLRATR